MREAPERCGLIRMYVDRGSVHTRSLRRCFTLGESRSPGPASRLPRRSGRAGRISSAAPISTAALGMPQTTLDGSSWAIVRQPAAELEQTLLRRRGPCRSAARPRRAWASSWRRWRRTRRPMGGNKRPGARRNNASRRSSPMMRWSSVPESKIPRAAGRCPSTTSVDTPMRLLREPLSQARSKCRIDMLDDDDRGIEVVGQDGEDLGQGIRPAGRGSEDNQGSTDVSTAVHGRRCRRLRLSSGSRTLLPACRSACR